jgi:hypothetical protein
MERNSEMGALCRKPRRQQSTDLKKLCRPVNQEFFAASQISLIGVAFSAESAHDAKATVLDFVEWSHSNILWFSLMIAECSPTSAVVASSPKASPNAKGDDGPDCERDHNGVP